MKRILSIIVLAMCLVFPGCDIWEDRSACPKILAVDCSLLEGKALDADIWIFGPDGSLFSRTRISEHEFYKEQTYYVQTGNYKCYVWANLGAGTVTSDINTLSGKLLKAASIEADPLFAYGKEVVCNKDTVLVKVAPRKMFIDVYVTFKGLKSSETASACLVSPFGGFSLNGESVSQECQATAEGNPMVRLRMLRPGALEGIKLTASFIRDGEVVLDSEFGLGEYLIQNNYDLLSDNLKDIYITIDVSRMKTVIGTDPLEFLPPVEIRY